MTERVKCYTITGQVSIDVIETMVVSFMKEV